MISLLFKRICLLLAVCTALACTEAPEKAEEGGTCTNSAECAEGQLCLKNECRDVDCLTSNDCDIEQYCSTEYACEAGCENDNDCFAGDSCNTSTQVCETYGCRDTQLDCEIGEFCNVPTGECYEDDQPHCRTCSLNDLLYPVFGEECLLWNETGGNCTVDLFFGTQSGCPSDEVCYPVDPADPFNPNGTCYKSYAVMSCDINAEEACPRGFSCVQLTYTDGSTTDVCYGDCQYYRENGYL